MARRSILCTASRAIYSNHQLPCCRHEFTTSIVNRKRARPGFVRESRCHETKLPSRGYGVCGGARENQSSRHRQWISTQLPPHNDSPKAGGSHSRLSLTLFYTEISPLGVYCDEGCTHKVYHHSRRACKLRGAGCHFFDSPMYGEELRHRSITARDGIRCGQRARKMDFVPRRV